MTYAEKMKAIVVVLKRRFTNLTVEESIDMAADILKAIDEEKNS